MREKFVGWVPRISGAHMFEKLKKKQKKKSTKAAQFNVALVERKEILSLFFMHCNIYIKAMVMV